MNKILLLLGLFLFTSNTFFAQSSEEALAYLNKLTEGQGDISEKLMRYISISAHSTNSAKINRKRQRLVSTTKMVRDHVKSTDGFYDDTSLRDAMLDYYNLSYNALNGDFKEIADMKDEANSDYEMMKSMIEIEEEVSLRLDSAQDELEQNIDSFAKQYNITLVREENPLSEMITKSNSVTQYYNDLFLPMFKVNLQNIKLKELLQSNDIEKIEAARKTTEVYAAEAREVFSQLSPYDGDNSLLEAAMVRVDYYVEEANVMAFNTIEYAKVSKKLEIEQEKIENTKAKKRTQEMVDDYNDLVDQANQLAQKLNLSANSFNNSSQKEQLQWQQLLQEFRKRHIPKYGLYEQEA